VNPRACRETELNYRPARVKKSVAVVGAGPAGLAAACVLAERGHDLQLFESAAEIGGQFNMAKRIPGKEEFHETLRYFRNRLERLGVRVWLNQRVTAEQLVQGRFDEVVLATGVMPRSPHIPGQDHPKVLSYVDVLLHNKPVGKRVAVIGAGGIGFDVAEFLVGEGHSPTLDLPLWLREWGVQDPSTARGGVAGVKPVVMPPARQVWLLQRKDGKPGAGLGKTTGWIHRATLRMKRVEMLSGVTYDGIDDRGLHISIDGASQVIKVDHLVLCTGQEPLQELLGPLRAAGVKVHVVGGADLATELDAKRAISQASRLAAEI
jgi:2,4-dienoyl-CoA reductase (NADPH2)